MNFPRATGLLDAPLLTLWVGGQWAIGYLAVPVLFQMLEDRRLAGTLAGEMFTAVAYVGLACGSLLMASLLYREGVAAWRNWRLGVLALMLGLILAGEFGLHPQVAALRESGFAEGSEEAGRFARLHGLASMLYLVNSLLGLGLVMAGSRRGD